MSKKKESGSRRRLPAVGKIVDEILAGGGFPGGARAELTELTRQAVDRARADLAAGRLADAPAPEEIKEQVGAAYAETRQTRLPTAINASGIILHTGLGRALMPAAAAAAVQRVAGRYCPLALDRETGGRGHRDRIAEELVCRLTGAEAATFAGNNAAATMLVLAALGAGREIVVSRGQLIEIGGAFRLPDVMEQSGAIMREVGTTNKTHLKDYAAAIGEQTAALLLVHLSNYRIVGFHQEVPLEELVALGRERELPVLHDLGSGALVDLGEFGLEREPLVPESIAAGAEIVFFSGDKLIGGPQCGVICGKKRTVDRIRKHPLARAMRVGKLTLAGLEETLKLFLDREALKREHPVYRMLGRELKELEQAAKKLAAALDGKAGLKAEAVAATAQLGSGSLPGQQIPSAAVALTFPAGEEELARRLRRSPVPVVGRRQGGRLLLDLRTVADDERGEMVELVKRAAGEK